MKILLVDELEVRCDVLESQLARWGLVPATASDGATALALLRQAAESAMPFDVAMLDLHAPALDDEALGRLVLEDPGLGTPALVLMKQPS